jgi:hypothetical protein
MIARAYDRREGLTVFYLSDGNPATVHSALQHCLHVHLLGDTKRSVPELGPIVLRLCFACASLVLRLSLYQILYAVQHILS